MYKDRTEAGNLLAQKLEKYGKDDAIILAIPRGGVPLGFIISEKLDLIDYGNYPNPFTERTVFAYELTDVVEKFTFTIYTVEGRKIRQLDNDNIISGANKNLPGYHEIEWDGKNQDGHAVGNGNYFYQIRAKNNKTVLERTGKILKVN